MRMRIVKNHDVTTL